MCSSTSSQVPTFQSSRSSCCVKAVLYSAIITKADFMESVWAPFFCSVWKKYVTFSFYFCPCWTEIELTLFPEAGTVLCLIWIENNVDNTLMFQLLPSTGQGLFSFSSCSANKEAWDYKKLGGDTARMTDPNWPKECSIPYDIVLST